MSRRILIADSRPELLDDLAATLQAAGFHALTAGNGLQALKHAATGQPDVIILEARLPDIGGAAVCDIMRRLPSTAGIPIILVTDPSDEPSRVLGAQNGADECLTRPFSPQALISSVSRILLRRAEAALAEEVAPTPEYRRFEAWV